ncbi:MAG: transposase zinc-binding domain-containing protein [Hyphomicrobium sp.]
MTAVSDASNVAVSAVELFRTAGLGGHVEGCQSCGAIRVAYKSCRNRHCPKCQGQAGREWMPHARPNSCRFPTSTWCSRCRPRSP